MIVGFRCEASWLLFHDCAPVVTAGDLELSPVLLSYFLFIFPVFVGIPSTRVFLVVNIRLVYLVSVAGFVSDKFFCVTIDRSIISAAPLL